MKVCPSCKREYPENEEFCATDGMKLRPKGLSFTDPLVGAMLDGRWVIEERIGEGGMGAVYRAHQQSVDRPVAIKTLRNEHIHDDEYVERFFREAQVAARISHPHCVTIHDFGQDPETGTLYLAMEYLDGQPLTERIEARDLSIAEVMQIGVQIASALAAAHETSVVHRDLKPDNVFLIDVAGGGTFVKVLDFGIAKLLEAETRMTRTGMVMGTPMYMSPEQCDGHEIDLRSDLYSLGCILYEALCGRAPFTAETPMAILLAHVSKPVVPPGELGVEVPDPLAAIVMRLLEKDPDDRFASAGELREALEGASGQLGDTSKIVGTSAMNRDGWVFDETAAMPLDSVESRKPAGDTIDSETQKTSPRLFIALAVMVFMVVGAGIGLGLALSDDEKRPSTRSPATISATPEAGETTEETGDDELAEVEDDTGVDDEVAAVEPSEPQATPDEVENRAVNDSHAEKEKRKAAEKRAKEYDKRREKLKKLREKRQKEREKKAEKRRPKPAKKPKIEEKPSNPIGEAVEDTVEEERKKVEESVNEKVDKIKDDTRKALEGLGL